jgi:uncharacterized protein (TIGR02453 family)
MAAKFHGFPVEAFEFYDALTADNTKAWWTAHKKDYDTVVRGPIEDLLAELAGEFGEGKIFRPYKDVRFSKDKTPYKDHQGAYVATEDGIGYYVQVSANGLMLAGGWWSSAPMQLARYREAAGSAPGAVLEKAIAAAEKGGLTLGGDVMKTRPRGVAEDHPRVDLLRHRSLTVERQVGTPTWVSTRKALTHVQKTWRAMTPLVEWLTDHVGPVDDGVPPEPR